MEINTFPVDWLNQGSDALRLLASDGAIVLLLVRCAGCSGTGFFASNPCGQCEGSCVPGFITFRCPLPAIIEASIAAKKRPGALAPKVGAANLLAGLLPAAESRIVRRGTCPRCAGKLRSTGASSTEADTWACSDACGSAYAVWALDGAGYVVTRVWSNDADRAAELGVR